jgi:hypothetical protein
MLITDQYTTQYMMTTTNVKKKERVLHDTHTHTVSDTQQKKKNLMIG